MGGLLPAMTPGLIFLIVLVPLTLAVGFALGLLYERWYNASTLRRTSKRFEKLLTYVNRCLDQTEKACALLQKQSRNHPLTSRQQSRFGQLCETITGHVKQMSTEAVSRSSQKHKSRSFSVPDWTRQPLDPRTELPDYIAVQQNLRALANAMRGSDGATGVLFLQLDHYSRHARQYGEEIANDFLKQVVSLSLRELRQSDLVCQLTEDVLVAFLPNVTSQELRALSEKIRAAVCHHQFLHAGNGETVFVTATFGYTTFTGSDVVHDDLESVLLERSRKALHTTRRHGRWQMREVQPDGQVQLIAS